MIYKDQLYKNYDCQANNGYTEINWLINTSAYYLEQLPLNFLESRRLIFMWSDIQSENSSS